MLSTENDSILEDDASFDEQANIHNDDEKAIVLPSTDEINDIIEDLKSCYESKNFQFNY